MRPIILLWVNFQGHDEPLKITKIRFLKILKVDGTSFSDAGSLVTIAHLTREICPRDLKYRKSKTNMLDGKSQRFYISVVCNFFTAKHYRSRCRSRWENIDRGQYPYQPIKYVNLVVPSVCETEPFNKGKYSRTCI